MIKKLLLIFFIWLLLIGVSFGATYYVSEGGSGNGSACGNAKSLSWANANLNSGDIGIMCDDGGNYSSTPISPTDNNVTYRAMSGDSPTITYTGGLQAVISYNNVTIDGIAFSGSYPLSYANGHQVKLTGDYNEVTNCSFVGGGIYSSSAALFSSGSYNYIHNNNFGTMASATDGDNAWESDCINLDHADHNRIISNTFGEGGGHAYIILFGGNNNVIRGNTGTTTNYWSDGTSESDALDGTVIIGDGASYTLVEDNTFNATSGDAKMNLQLGSTTYNIIRRNVIYGMVMGNSNNTTGTHEYNMYYNNTFYNVNNTSEGAWLFTGGSNPTSMKYDKYINNILHTWKNGYAIHLYNYANISNNEFRNNIVYKSGVSTNQVRRKGFTMNLTGGSPSFEADYPSEASDNLITEPTFTNAAGGDFTADDGDAPQVDAGTFFVNANGGSGGGDSTALVVYNNRYFWDGYGISGETADYICIGSDGPVQISSVNANGTNITLVAPGATWSDNDPVYLAISSTVCYNGDAPDIGAEEFDSADVGGLTITNINSGNLSISNINSGNLTITPQP